MKYNRRICSAFLCLFLTLSVCSQSVGIVMPTKGICAHRGGMDTHPENTMPAFRNAIANGVQMIEFDLHFSKDSVLVIMHDDSVDRTTDGKGEIAALTLAEIKKLDAGVKKSSAFKGARVPTFEETIAIMPRNIWLNCHLKGGAALGKATALMIRKLGREGQCFLACSEDAAEGARQAVPDIRICNAENKYRSDNRLYTEATIKMKAPFIQLIDVGTTEERLPFIRELKANHVQVNYFYAAKAEQAKELWDSGVDFILVNDLPTFLPEMKKYGIKPVQNIF